MKSIVTRIALALLVSIPVVQTASCGADPVMERPIDPRRRGRKAAGPPPDQLVVVKLNNPGWQHVSPHFQKFLAQQHATPKDAFRPNSTRFIQLPVIEKEEEIEPEANIEALGPVGPLQMFPVRDYDLKAIMSGTAVPKAMIVDPQGGMHVIEKDTALGNKGGIVESITQYLVVVKEPNAEEPVLLQAKPELIDLVSRTDKPLKGDDAPLVD